MRFFREILIAFLMCAAALVASPVAAQTTYRIQIPAFEKAALHADTQLVRPPIEPRATLSSLPYAQWLIEPVAGTPYHRIAQSTRPDWYLHNENKTLMVGPIQPGWWSAQWQIDPVFGAKDQWRICNRWTFECLTHGETSGVFLTKSLAGHAPSNWTIPGFKVNQVAAAAPTPTTTPITRIGAGTPPKTTGTQTTRQCGPSLTCYIQITGLIVNKRSEISDDEIYVKTTQNGTETRFPATFDVFAGSTIPSIATPNPRDIYKTVYPYMAMNESKPGHRAWSFCGFGRLDSNLVVRVLERDENAAVIKDNFSGGDDDIGTVVFMNMLERTGPNVKQLTGDGSRYLLLYNVAASREELPACGPTSVIRDSDLAIWKGPYQPSECEDKIANSLGVPDNTQVAIAFIASYSVCEIDAAVKAKRAGAG
jgi:hypothetical protein